MDADATIDREPVPDYVARTRLDDRIYAVFGAGRGIGRQCAHALHQTGARIVCIDNDATRGSAVAKELDGSIIIADMTAEGAADAVINQIVAEHGRLDGIVDIVGASFGAPFLEADADLIRRNFDLNLHQAMSVTRAGAAAMAKTGGGGTIVLAGAISDGRGIAAAEVMGADLAYLGTRFIATKESLATADYKRMIVDSKAADIVYTPAVSGIPGSFLRDSLSRAGIDPDDPTAKAVDMGAELDSDSKAWKHIWSAGQGVGGIDDIPDTAALVARLKAEYADAVAGLNARAARPAAE